MTEVVGDQRAESTHQPILLSRTAVKTNHDRGRSPGGLEEGESEEDNELEGGGDQRSPDCLESSEEQEEKEESWRLIGGDRRPDSNSLEKEAKEEEES